jgi:hypothetical protein
VVDRIRTVDNASLPNPEVVQTAGRVRLNDGLRVREIHPILVTWGSYLTRGVSPRCAVISMTA